MMRPLIFAFAVAVAGAYAAPADAAPRDPAARATAPAQGKVKVAKAPKKSKKGEKPAAPVAPEGARVDPRTAPSSAADAGGAPAAGPELGRRGMSRIEFDDRLVQGQTNKANAIYLFERRESALRSLLKKRTDFHEEIDETLE